MITVYNIYEFTLTSTFSIDVCKLESGMNDAEIRHRSKMENAKNDSSCDLAMGATLRSDIAVAVI